MNYIFKYQNLPQAFKKEIKTNGVGALYQGALPFLATYCAFVSLQFTIYEKTIEYYKKKYGTGKEWEEREFYLNMKAGLLAGASAAAVTNGLEAVTVAK